MTPTDLVAFEIRLPTDLSTSFRGGGIDAILARVETDARAVHADATTSKGRDVIRAIAFKVARSKTALDDAGKKLNEDARTQINAVDAERRKVRDRLDALRDEVRAPLTKWEADEADRVQRLKDRLDRVRLAHTMLPEYAPAEQIGALLGRVEGIAIDDTWAEFTVEDSVTSGRSASAW